MEEEKRVFTAYIGEVDIQEWTQGIGKAILMPILLKTCEEVIIDELEEERAARIEFLMRGKSKSVDFLVRRDGIDDTLNKIMEWSLEEEHYEMCSKVKGLQDYLERLQNEDFSYRG